ncbi:MAG: exodeoxyribonuclease III [Gammaproteobacteria bacterium]
MRIATWNINGLRARIDFMRYWLDARQPDVVGLQELKMTDEQFPAAEFEAAGYHAITHGQKAWNGVAILSRQPAQTVQTGLPGEAEFGARLVSAKVADLDFTTVYCPNGKSVGHEDYARKLAWFDSLAEYLERTADAGAPTVLCGDFNICPTPLDSWDEEGHAGEIFHTAEERQRFQRVLAWGLKDIYRERYPDSREFSWWDYRAGGFPRNQGLRIDFLLATPSVLDRVTSVQIDRDFRKKKEGLTASDHAPVIADLD